MAILQCNDLSIGYDGRTIFEHIDFSVEAGDYLSIIGHNGSGKSTLIKTILGLQKPVFGSVSFLDGLSARDIGYLPQQNSSMKNFPASVYEIVLSGCQNKLGLFAFYTAEHKARVQQNLERLGIADLAKKSFKELSGGQRQRVLLARALCATEKLILLDEPVTGLDPVATKEMYEIIQTLNAQGITVIMISHDIQAAQAYSKRILELNRQEGKLIWQK